ncbi:hypothetical protein [Natrarchaeobaculum sulfurireducens]|uniref:PIN domain-containing protein n=1 Tax=Natrarchaeobaculum sulfurireducens TaxID=2044521 RepID=A0A346PMH2_9EURY|nr:hypothetical protein [Natrarchaeobaculum sulfurireducens]AXR80717.1 hypothetical protein AArcMg_0695 [Natrarchaeobaculum sulfurireducens]
MTQEELILDTSVLFNYVYVTIPVRLERDKGCKRLIDGDEFYCVIGGKVKQEFENRCDKRLTLYEDAVKFLRDNPGKDIYEYFPSERDINASPSDESHWEGRIQMQWYDKDRRKQLSDLRRIRQDLDRFKVVLIQDLIDEEYSKAQHTTLRDSLDSQLQINHDCDVIVDAVEICIRDAIDTLIAVDSDITSEDHREGINDIITDTVGEHACLTILTAEEV